MSIKKIINILKNCDNCDNHDFEGKKLKDYVICVNCAIKKDLPNWSNNEIDKLLSEEKEINETTN